MERGRESLDNGLAFRLLHRSDITQMGNPFTPEEYAAKVDIRGELAEDDDLVCRVLFHEAVDQGTVRRRQKLFVA